MTLANIIHIWQHFLGFPLEEAYTEKIRHLDSEELRQRFFLAVRSWIEAVSRSGPVVLAFSDMQWADEFLLRAAEILFANLRS